MLFFKSKKNSAEPDLEPDLKPDFQLTGRTYRIMHAQDRNFRGYKRYFLTTYGIDDIQENLASFADTDALFGKEIFVEEGILYVINPPTEVLNFYVDGKRIGCSYNHLGEDSPDKPSLYKVVTNNLVEKVVFDTYKDGDTYRARIFCKLK